jgi:hypothetical protein
MVQEDRKVTSWLIADTLGIPKTVVLWISSEDLRKRKLCARFAPHALTREQMGESPHAKTRETRLTVKRTFWTRSLQVTRVGVLVTIPK